MDGYSSCQTLPRATTSATVTAAWTAGTQYTIQVFKGANCAGVGKSINKTPVTTVSLVSGSVGQSSASLTLGHHEGAWSYQGGEVSGQGAGRVNRDGPIRRRGRGAIGRRRCPVPGP